MKFGVGIPNCREGMFYPMSFVQPQDIVKLVQLAERLGFDSVWGTDFINPSPTMKFPEMAKPNWYELMISLSYLAAATKTIKLAAGVVLLPYRDPVILAKQAATLDQFSNGRFIFGWGLGGFRDEFLSIKGKMQKAHRGKMLEEHMEALHLLLNSDGKVDFNGEYYEFHDVELNPKPVQKPLPIFISGHTAEAPKRLAKWGTGFSVSSKMIAEFNGNLGNAMKHLKESIAKEGVDPDIYDYELSTQLIMANNFDEGVKNLRECYLGKRLGARNPIEAIISTSLIGSADDIASQAQAIKETGITLCMATNIAVDNFPAMMEQVQWFGEDIISKFDR